MPQKLLTMIVPCHNSSESLPESLASLLNQKGGLGDVEVILVDDASSDGEKTLKVMYDFKKLNPETKIICLEVNKRQGGARNTALKQATGKYVGFLDSDDQIDTRYCEKLLALAENEAADIVQFGQTEFVKNEKGESIPVREIYLDDETIEIDSDDQRKSFVIVDKMTLTHSNKIYRRSLLEAAGVRFGENVIYEEPLFTYPLRFHVNKLTITSDCLYYVFLRNDSTMRKEMNDSGKISDHMNQCLELMDFMQKSEFSDRFSSEIDFRFIHSYIMETLIFLGKRGHTLELSQYEAMRQIVFARMGRPVKNIYIKPGSLYYTVMEILEKDNMTQEALDEIVSAISEV